VFVYIKKQEGQNVLEFHPPGESIDPHTAESIDTHTGDVRDPRTAPPRHLGIDISAFLSHSRRIAQPPARGPYSARPTELQQPVTALGLLWHRRLGHAGPRALRRLTAAIVDSAPDEDVELIGPETHECPTCATSKAKQILSRISWPRATRPFEHIHFDMIFEEHGYNDATRAVHFFDEAMKMHHVRCINSTAQLTQTVIDYVTWIEKRFECTVRFLRTDGERSLGHDFSSWIQSTGVTYECSTPYNH
jgi:hypothetical protein